MNFIDIIIIIPTIYFAWLGFKKGFVISLFTLLALLVGLYAGIHLSDLVSQKLIENDLMNGEYTSPVAFTLVFLVVGAVVYFVGALVQRLLKTLQLNFINKFIGLVLGLIKSAYILSFVLILMESYDKNEQLITPEHKSDSALYKPTKWICLNTLPAIKESLLIPINQLNFKKDSVQNSDE